MLRKLYSDNTSLCFSEEEGKIQIEQQIEKISLKMSQMAIEGSPAQSSHSEDSDVSEAENSTIFGTTKVAEESRSRLSYDITDESDASGNVKHSDDNENSEMIFLPHLKELTHLIKASERTDIQDELVRSVEKFKRASDEYKKQIGLTVCHQKRPTNVNSDTDISTSSEMKESKSAQKRKSEPSSKVKTPLLHNLLAGSSFEDDSDKKIASIFWQTYASEDACKEFAKSSQSESISDEINTKHVRDVTEDPTKIQAPWNIVTQNKDDDGKIQDAREETVNNEVFFYICYFTKYMFNCFSLCKPLVYMICLLVRSG